MNLHLQDEEIDATTQLIKLDGELDLYTAPAFRERLAQLVASGKTTILVDFSQLAFVDASNTLDVMLQSVTELRSGDASLAFVCGDESLRRVFEITGLDRAFPTYSSGEAALAALRGSPERPGRDAEPSPVAGKARSPTPREHRAETRASEQGDDPAVVRARRDVEKAWRKLHEAERAAGNVPFKAYSSPEEALAKAGRSPPGIAQLLRARAEFEAAMTALNEAEVAQRARKRRGTAEAEHDQADTAQNEASYSGWSELETTRQEASRRGWRWA